MSDRVAVYSAYIDWYGHGGLSMGLDGWHYRTTQPDSVYELSTEQVYLGTDSIKVTPQVFTNGELAQTFSLPANVETTLSVWVYNPNASGSIQLTSVSPTLGALGSDSTSLLNQWVELTVVFLETQPTEVSIIVSRTGLVGTEPYYLGWSQVHTEFDDVSCDALIERQVPDMVTGRDAARDLAEVASGEMSLMLNNDEGKYTPGNLVSPFARQIGPSREVLIQGTIDGETYTLFTGFTDTFDINSSLNDRSISFDCIDLIGRLAETPVHTEMFESIRTGDAVREVIRAAGLYSTLNKEIYASGEWDVFDPYIDTGATTLTMWSYTGDAKEGLDQILDAEGPPSLYTTGWSNQVIYKDRHHRVRPTYAAAVDTFHMCETDVVLSTDFAMSEGSHPSYGWDTFFNRVIATSSYGVLDDDISTIWTDPSPQRTLYGKTVITADVAGFMDGQAPVPGYRVLTNNPGPDDETDIYVDIQPEDPDFVVENGTVTVDSYNVSGTQVSITLVAAGTATITGLRFRGRAIKKDDTKYTADDTGSQTVYKDVKVFEYDAGSASANDTADVALWMLRKNSSPRPFATLIIQNRNLDYTKMILGRKLSEAINVSVDDWNIHQEFAVEGIQHHAGELGRDHSVELYVQQIDPNGYDINLFTFDEDGRGFDFGVFGEFAEGAFTFGEAGHGFGDGAFGLNTHTNVPFTLGVSQLDSSDEVWY
jgi:hypothetical protein